MDDNLLDFELTDLLYVIKKLLRLNYISLNKCGKFIELGSLKEEAKKVLRRDGEAEIILNRENEFSPIDKLTVNKFLNIVNMICTVESENTNLKKTMAILRQLPELLDVFTLNISINKLLPMLSKELSLMANFEGCKICFTYNNEKYEGSFGRDFHCENLKSILDNLELSVKFDIARVIWETKDIGAKTQIYIKFKEPVSKEKVEEFYPMIEMIVHILHTFLTEYAKRRDIERFTDEFLNVFVSALEAKDPFTKGHSIGVAYYAKKIAEKMNFTDEKIKKIKIASLLHDIGKIAISETILRKAGSLTPYEYEEIKKHPDWSYKIISQVNSFKNIALWARFHHERLDGSGYPLGLTGEEIPVESQIIAISDTIESMIAGRPYAERKTRREIIEEIKKFLGRYWREDVGRAAIEILKEEEENVKNYIGKNDKKD
ncbi:MAG: HD domain-containing protein [Caldisericia bacterium]|nr:HD domain-containing protein [Caldisericia bacterium]